MRRRAHLESEFVRERMRRRPNPAASAEGSNSKNRPRLWDKLNGLVLASIRLLNEEVSISAVVGLRGRSCVWDLRFAATYATEIGEVSGGFTGTDKWRRTSADVLSWKIIRKVHRLEH